jgi:hypothetical protein
MSQHTTDLQPKPFQVFVTDDSNKDIFTEPGYFICNEKHCVKKFFKNSNQ